MKWAASLVCCLTLGPGLFHSQAGAAELTAGRTVYLLPMGHSLDQFIADQLTRSHVFQVVTDPAKADMVITDRVGAGLQARLKELNPPPPPPPPPDPEGKGAKAAAKSTPDTAKPAGDALPPASGPLAAFGDTTNKVASAGSMGIGSRGRGTIFLVDIKSTEVLWSIFETPRNNSPRELDRTAARIVKQLKLDLAAQQ